MGGLMLAMVWETKSGKWLAELQQDVHYAVTNEPAVLLQRDGGL
jgi:hypothetical protein